MKGFVLSVLLTTCMSASAWNKDIVTYKTVRVKTPVGTAPRLPYQLWVTYTDGSKEYRQVRWNNSAIETEQAQADAKQNPVGAE